MNVFSSFSSPSSCPHLYRSPGYSDNNNTASDGHSQVILRHYNHTGRLQNRSTSSGQNQVSVTMAVFLCFSVLIILENLVVLAAVLSRIRHSRRWVYVCIANITLSDLLTGVAYVVNICLSGSQTFHLTPALWLFREGMLFVALAASIFSLLLIAVERYTTMMKPLPQKSDRKAYYRIFGLVALCWVLALVIGFLPLLGWNCVCSLDECSTLLPLYSKSYILFSLIIFFLILLAIGLLYGAIYRHVHRNAERARKRSMALLKTVIAIVGVFLLCWGPLFVLLLLDYSCSSRQCVVQIAADFCISLAVLNSGLNPIIYTLGSSDLKKAIAELLCCCCCCCCVKVGFCHPGTFTSKESSSTSETRRDSLRNSFNKSRSQRLVSPPPTPRKPHKAPRKSRLSTTTSCLSVSSG